MINKKKIKKIISLVEMILVVSMSFAAFISFNAKDAEAANVCCEKTKGDNPEYCTYVDANQCAGLKAPTTCDKTSFCKAGCCYDKQGDGFCYSNYGKALCVKANNGTFEEDATCNSVNACKMGCCILGNQAVFTTEIQCRKETSVYSDLTYDFRGNIQTEAECLNFVRKEDLGCCVASEESNTCKWTTRSSCSVSENTASNSTIGFYKGKRCSTISGCCTPANPANGGNNNPKSTMCLDTDDSVHWKDSCGNDDGIKEDSKCDYNNLGTLCGDSDKDGEYTCESVDCEKESSTNDKLSLNLDGFYGTKGVSDGGVLNGESWCIYDRTEADKPVAGEDKLISGKLYHAPDPVGARYYRSSCINGKEFTEPCKDLRREFCVSSTVDVNAKTYTEAKCVENRATSCITQCNTANGATQNEAEFYAKQKDDIKCCADISKRDCAWTGKCVPKVSMGFNLNEKEGANVCSVGNIDCKFIIRCGGWESLFKTCEGDWEILDGSECLDQEFLVGANNFCRSLGDCGANYNLAGILSKDGFSNTPTFGKEIDESLLTGGTITGKNLQDIADEEGYVLNTIVNDQGYIELPGYLPDDINWTRGSRFFNWSAVAAADSAWWRLFGMGWGESSGGLREAVNVGGLLLSISALIYTGTSSGGGIFSGFPILGKNAPDKNIIFGGLSALSGWIKGKPKTSEATPAASAAVYSPGSFIVTNVLNKQGSFLNKITAMVVGNKISGLYGADEPPDSNVIKSDNTGGLLASAGLTLTDTVVGGSTPAAAAPAAAPAAGAAAGEGSWLSSVTGSSWLSYAAWAYMIYNIVDVAFEDVREEKVSVTCKPWIQPITTEEDQCEQCNPQYHVDEKGVMKNVNALKACSPYRCASYGANCKLLNEGTTKENCVYTDPYGANSPVISPFIEGFDKAYQGKVVPTSGGMKIATEPPHIPVYTNVKIAIKTDKPSQCKMSWNHSKEYDKMEPVFFGSEIYEYEHIQTIWAPYVANASANSLALTKGGDATYKIYIRCQDGAGRANDKDYAIEFTVGSEPDITAPKIEGASLPAENYLLYGANSSDVTLFLNEPSQCKWSLLDQDYEKMLEANKCSSKRTNVGVPYECSFVSDGAAGIDGPTVSGIGSSAGVRKSVYFRCMDATAKKNTNKESHRMVFIGSNPLNISSISPSGDITSRGSENITLEVRTFDGAKKDGTSTCKYGWNDEITSGDISRMTDFFGATNAPVHTQQFVELSEGKNTFYIGCYDDAGNTVYGNTTIDIKVDREGPQIARVFKDSTTTPPLLKVEVNEQAVCLYSISKEKIPESAMIQDDNEGKKWSISADKNSYYIQCKDGYDNKSPIINIVLLDRGATSSTF